MSDADRALAMYRRTLTRVGETVQIRRYSGVAPTRTSADTAALARVAGFEPHELVGSIVQGDRKVIVYGPDVAALTKVLTTDKVVVRGKELAIVAVDDSTRRVAGTLIALEIQARG